MRECVIGFVCDIGIGPQNGGRKRNEDNFLICADGAVMCRADDGELDRVEQSGDGILLAVCDGMGGHDDGDVASAAAVRVLRKLYQPSSPRNPARVLLKYIEDSHRQLHQAARNDGQVSMGTTLTAAWLIHGTLAWAHVGDSRLYLQRGIDLVQLTIDQTRNEFARRDGRPTTRDGEHLVQNFIYGSRGLGDDPGLRLEHGLDSGAEVLREGDRILLCSDGISSVMSFEDLRATLGAHDDPQQAAEQLRSNALSRGSRDNLTAIVVRVDEVVPTA